MLIIYVHIVFFSFFFRNTELLYKYRILKPRATINIFQIRNNVNSKLEVDTHVLNNVMLYKYEKPNYFKYMTVFSAIQFCLFTAITYFLIEWLPEFQADDSLFTYLKRNVLYLSTFLLPFIGGDEN